MDPDSFNPLRKDVIDLMNSMCKNDGFGLMVFMLTNILESGSELISIGSYSNVIANTFNVTLKDNSAYVPGVLSRKKQIIPPLTNAMVKNS